MFVCVRDSVKIIWRGGGEKGRGVNFPFGCSYSSLVFAELESLMMVHFYFFNQCVQLV